METLDKINETEVVESILGLLEKAKKIARDNFGSRFTISMIDNKVNTVNLHINDFCELVLDETCKYFNLDKEKVISSTRVNRYVDCRRVFYVYVFNRKRITLEELSAVCNRKHANMIYTFNKHKELINSELDYRIKYNEYCRHMDNLLKKKYII